MEVNWTVAGTHIYPPNPETANFGRHSHPERLPDTKAALNSSKTYCRHYVSCGSKNQMTNVTSEFHIKYEDHLM